MTTITYENVVSHLLERVPEFRHAYEKHVAYYDGVITYPLFGELIRFMRDAFYASTPLAEGEKAVNRSEVYFTRTRSSVQADSAKAVYDRLIAFIEDCANSEDWDVSNLIRVGVMESLHLTGEHYHAIVASLHPTSKKLFDEIELYWHEFGKPQLVEVLGRYKTLGVLIGTKHPELLLPPSEALRLADDLGAIGVTIMGLDGWYYVKPNDNTAIGQDLGIDFYVGDAVLYGENRVRESVAAVKEFIINHVPEATPFISFTLDIPSNWDLFPNCPE